MANVRTVDLHVRQSDEPIELLIDQEFFGGVECVVWDSALVLCKYMEYQNVHGNQTSLDGKRVLELGCGTGVCAIAAAVYGASAIATDLTSALSLVDRNISANQHSLQGSVISRHLDWTNKETIAQLLLANGDSQSQLPFDVIIVADCIYYDASLMPLLSTLYLLAQETTTILCCYEKRDIGKPQVIQEQFERLVPQWFDVANVPGKEQHPEYQSEDLCFLKLKKRQSTSETISMSIIIPVLNAADWLEECFESIISQLQSSTEIDHVTLADALSLEVSVYNDGSTDQSKTIVETWSKRFLTNQVNFVFDGHDHKPRGVGFAKNAAIAQSAGDWLCFLDADDYMLPGRLMLLVDQIKLKGCWTLIGSQVSRNPCTSTPRLVAWANGLSHLQLFTQRYTSHGPTLLAPSWCCSRALWSAVSRFDTPAESLGFPEDLTFFYKAIAAGCDLCLIPRPLVCYRYHKNCASHTVAEETIWSIRLKQFETDVLNRWLSWTIWGAGKEGRRFFRSLSPTNQLKVTCFCDVDQKKIANGHYEYYLSQETPKPKIPILHYLTAKPPFVICVKQGLTSGDLEQNIAALNLREGIDFYHFG